jgi:hypothetical protein
MLIDQLRQGDVLLRLVKNVNTKDLKKLGTEKYILALGETSGHSHVIHGANTFAGNKQIYVQVEKHAMLQHELVDGTWTGEYKPVPIEAGVYQVIQQREQDLLEQVKLVQD